MELSTLAPKIADAQAHTPDGDHFGLIGAGIVALPIAITVLISLKN